jgi:hypothetical protein
MMHAKIASAADTRFRAPAAAGAMARATAAAMRGGIRIAMAFEPVTGQAALPA